MEQLRKHFEMADHGTIVLILPITQLAKDWWQENVEEGDRWNEAHVVRTGEVASILDGFLATLENEVQND